MTINNITQTISELPAPPHRGVEVQTQFVIKQEDFQDHLAETTIDELNTLKTQLNARIGEINSTTTTMNGYATSASSSASTATTKAGEASTSASEALTSRNQASTFATNSSNSATKASQWADNNYNVEVEAGKYSAKHWSTVAQNTVNNKIEKVTSTDNAVVRFNGTTGDVQNSGVTVDDSGNVGIGVTPSAWAHKTVQINGCHISSNGLAHSEIGMNTGYSGGNDVYLDGANSAVKYIQRYDGAHLWQAAPSGPAGNPITWASIMSLDSTGALTLNSGGITSFGTTINVSDFANSYTYIKRWALIDATAIFESAVAGVRKSAILANGTYQSATNVYGSTSDAKLKENIDYSSPKLDKLMQVKVRTFNYIGQEEKQIGVIAQEIEQIFPSLVFETKDTKQVEVTKTRDITDEDGNVTQEEYTETETQETGEVTKNVKYSIIYMMMLKGMQEQQEIINDLKARIEILEGAK